MLGKISTIAVIENTIIELCTIGSKTLSSPLIGGKTTNHNKKRFDPTNEYIFSKNTSGAEC